MAEPAVATSVGGHLPLLDGARAIAAFMVLLTHAGAASGATERSIFGPLLARGDWGVALFFVLSGFLLTRPWVRWRLGGGRTPGVAEYFRKRAVRILPAYWLALVAVLLLIPQVVTPAGVVSNIFLLQTYTGPLLDGFFQSWSLCTEVAFYLALPLLAPLLVRRSLRFALTAIAIVALVTPVWIMLCQEWAPDAMPPYAIIWLPGHLDWFCAGMALAVLERALHKESLPTTLVGPNRWLIGALVAFGLALTPLAGPLGWQEAPSYIAIIKEFLYGATAFLLVGAMMQPAATTTLWGRTLNSRVIAWAGGISYGFFLWHNMILDRLRDALGMTFGGGGFWVTLVATTALTLIVSQLSYALMERPLMNRFGRSSPRPADTGGGTDGSGPAAPGSPDVDTTTPQAARPTHGS